MTVTITLPQNLEAQLKQKAQIQKSSIEEMVLEILDRALTADNDAPSPENVVAKIRALPPKTSNLRTPSGSLATALRQAPINPEFDLQKWEKEWTEAKAEMRQMTHNNSIAEGRA